MKRHSSSSSSNWNWKTAALLIAVGLFALHFYYSLQVSPKSSTVVPISSIPKAVEKPQTVIAKEDQAKVCEQKLFSVSPETCSIAQDVSNEFTKIYVSGGWSPVSINGLKPQWYYSYSDLESLKRVSLSGGGSNLGELTRNSLVFMSEVINEHNIRSMIDIPCGDVNWQFESWEIDSMPCYVGLDVTAPVIELDKVRYAHHTNKQFFVWDFTACELPKISCEGSELGPADCVHVRDVIQHLSLQKGKNALDNVVKSGARWLIATTYRDEVNRDITTGNTYRNNLEETPFNLPVSDRCVYTHFEVDPDHTCLWDLDEVRKTYKFGMP